MLLVGGPQPTIGRAAIFSGSITDQAEFVVQARGSDRDTQRDVLERAMNETTNDTQARIYQERADEYDALIAAEDADGLLRGALTERLSWQGRRVADVGAGTGRLSRWFAPLAEHVDLIDRAAPMLEVARRRLQSDGVLGRVSTHVADVRSLPLEDGSVDIAAAGWVFGHFRHWMPDGWRQEVGCAVEEMRRIVVPGGSIIVIETLGTGHREPRKHTGLDEYFAYLEELGFERSWVRTDYEFADVDSAAETMGGFFGDELVAKIRKNQWRRVPECTALFSMTR